MGQLKLNYLAILVATVVAQAIGAGWYGLWTDQWLAYNDFTLEYVEENASTAPYIVSIIASLISFTIMAIIYKRMNIRTFQDALKTSALIALAFAWLPIYTTSHFEFNVNLGLINATNSFLGLLVGGLIIGTWVKVESD